MRIGKDKISIRQLPPETRTTSGLYIPDTVQRKPRYGIVEGVGEYNRELHGSINEGDMVSFGEGTGEYLEDDLIIMHPINLFSKIVDGKQVALGSDVIVRLETKYSKSKGSILLDAPILDKGEEVFFDKRSRLTIYGIVESVPHVQPVTSEGKRINPILKEGDKVYFRYMNTADMRTHLDESVSKRGEDTLIRVPYEDIFCKIDNGIVPVGEWIIADPYIEGDGEIEIIDGYPAKVVKSPHGLILSINSKKSKHRATVRFVGGLMDDPSQVKEGDVIYSRIGVNFENEIEGKTYYCLLESHQVDAIWRD